MLRLTRLLALAAALVIAAPGIAHAEWRRAESPHFIIHGDMSEGEIREYARKVERFHSMLELFMPPRRADIVPPKLNVYVTDGMSDMRRIWPTIPDSVGGFYSRSYDGIYAVADERQGSGDTTLFHEYAHHYMYQHQNEAYPGWFVEGFAEYFAPSDMRFGQVRYGLWRDHRLAALANLNGWIPMEDVLRSRLRLRSAEQGAAYYAQAWLLTHYMLGTPERQRQLSAYLTAVSRGADPVEALQTHVSTTPESLTRALRTYLQTGVTTYKLTAELPTADVQVSRHPSSASEALFLSLRASRGVDEEDRDDLVAQARRVVDRHPDDRLAAYVLAKAQRAVKDLPAAQSTLEALIAREPKDAEALWLLADVLQDRADDLEGAEAADLRRQANRHLAVAYEADPFDFRVYRALLRNRKDAANYPSENDLTLLESAYALAPQLPGNGVDYAGGLMARGRDLEAVVILAPLANNPHGGDLSELRERLAEARRKAGLDAIDQEAPPPAPEPEEGEESDGD